MPSQSETFLNYRGYIWLWINSGFLLLLAVIYASHSPLGGPSGGTVLGYVYGALATAGILYLTWYGARKRSYRCRHTTLKGCLAAHVWLGVSLAVIVPLHSGFQFGWNVHTLTYLVMMAVVGSGIWGAFQFRVLPEQVESHRGGPQIPKLVEQIYTVSSEINRVEESSGTELRQFMEVFDFEFSEEKRIKISDLPDLQLAKNTITKLSAGDSEKAYAFLKLATKKRDTALTLLKELSTLGRLRLWLYIHLPLTVALLVLLFIHIFSVTYY